MHCICGFRPLCQLLLASPNRVCLRCKCVLSCMQPYRYSRRLWAALLAEFIGMAIFQIYGGSANDEVAAFGNGLTLAVVSKPPRLSYWELAAWLPYPVLHGPTCFPSHPGDPNRTQQGSACHF